MISAGSDHGPAAASVPGTGGFSDQEGRIVNITSTCIHRLTTVSNPRNISKVNRPKQSVNLAVFGL